MADAPSSLSYVLTGTLKPYKPYWVMKEGWQHPKIITMHIIRESVSTYSEGRGLSVKVYYMVQDTYTSGGFRTEPHELTDITIIGEV